MSAWSVFTDFYPLLQVNRNYLLFGGEGGWGIHISLAAILNGGTHITIDMCALVICVRGYTYHGGTHFTATPVLLCLIRLKPVFDDLTCAHSISWSIFNHLTRIFAKSRASKHIWWIITFSQTLNSARLSDLPATNNRVLKPIKHDT